MRIMALIIPREFFHTLEISASTAKKLKNSAFFPRYYHGYVFAECGRHHQPGRTPCLSRASYGRARVRACACLLLKLFEPHVIRRRQNRQNHFFARPQNNGLGKFFSRDLHGSGCTLRGVGGGVRQYRVRDLVFVENPHRSHPRDDATQLTNRVALQCFRSHLWLADMRL